MNSRQALFIGCVALLLGACSTAPQQGTLAELHQVAPDVDEVYLDDSLERAAESYRNYLEKTPESSLTPEAMRRLADLQVEQEYGVLGGKTDIIEMRAPVAAKPQAAARVEAPGTAPSAMTQADRESDHAFEQRASEREQLLATDAAQDTGLAELTAESVPSGPREAIKTYQKILANYPDYERNDQVLYQMSRAYDEIGQPDDAMEVMNRLITEYPYSKFIDEVQFRRGEYYFVRKNYLDAEDAYGAIIGMGDDSYYFELALYKMGWTLYKQELYEQALNNYVAMLDHRESIGYDFDKLLDENEEHRIADTFRVISLSFSNLGGPEVVDEYFAERGQRSYADKIYGNLGEFYFSKLRYEDAAAVYKSFTDLNPFHRVAPRFNQRVIEIYGEAGFPQLVVESKKEFASRYARSAEYWQYFNIDEAPEAVAMLKVNLTDLANHYHALYQDEELADERPEHFLEAERWYGEFLASFPADDDSPQINYQLADLLLENENFGEAARAYEQTAYAYAPHEQAAAAGYAAVYAYRSELEAATGANQLIVKQATVASSLRFADSFRDHPQAAVVLGAAADDLYDMQEFTVAIDSAQKLIDRYPSADQDLLRSAWAVIGHSSIDLARYVDAEFAYQNVLALTPADDETRPAIIDGLAAAIYKQGEQANLLGDYRTAANHFLRIKDVAPTSSIRTAAEYDGAAALMKLEDWAMASTVLEEFRINNPDHELETEATKQLATVYRKAGQIERSAVEYERIAAEASDPELSRQAMLTAGELYDEVKVTAEAIRVYDQYVSLYPRPLDIAMETRTRLSELFKQESDYTRYNAELAAIVATDRDSGGDRTDRSRFLASKAALVLAQQDFDRFAQLPLDQPFEKSLAEKQQRMDTAMASLEKLVDYEVADVTAAATFYIAETYLEFSNALINSERPAGLTSAEKTDYEMVIEEEAYPFEEKAIGVHEQNFELLAAGVYNPWVQQSLDKLADLMPGRYAKSEISEGYVGSIDSYAYRMPGAPPIGVEEVPNPDVAQDESQAPAETEAEWEHSAAYETR
ncbi:MAG TPA: tetratricopeptide repeat protein [Woeseiaceae bacterium]|nr:tetratricopeptide repeat protein [Woeseiaceae bacterium]